MNNCSNAALYGVTRNNGERLAACPAHLHDAIATGGFVRPIGEQSCSLPRKVPFGFAKEGK